MIRNLNQVTFQGFGSVPPERTQNAKLFEKNEAVDVVVRPEDIMLVGEDIGQISGIVKSVLFKGVHYEMMIDTGETTFKVHSTVMQPQGSRVGVNIVPYNIHIMKPMSKEATENA